MAQGIALIVAAALVLYGLVALLNVVYFFPLLRIGYRPWRVPARPSAPEAFGMARGPTLTGRAIVGWSTRYPGPFVLTVAEDRATFVGGTRVIVDRERVRSVRTARWWGGRHLVFDAPDHVYGGIVLRPDDDVAATALLRRCGWPIDAHPS